MNHSIKYLLLVVFPIFFSVNGITQSINFDSLEKEIFLLNNKSKYDSSVIKLTKILETEHITNDEKCNTYILLANTYKRLFDYTSTKRYIDSAKKYALSSKNKNENLANVNCEYAYIYFDLQEYDDAGKIMNTIKQNNYAYIDPNEKGKIIMQEAYLAYLNKKYTEAEKLYFQALNIMDVIGSYNKPIVYGKMIELYLRTHQEEKANDAYKIGIADAIKYDILKYQLYINQMMSNGYGDNKDYDKAFKYNKIADSIHEIYNEEDYLLKSKDLQIEYNNLKAENVIAEQKTKLAQRNLYLYSLLFAIILALLATAYILLSNKRRKEKFLALNQEKFTNQLLQNIELERKRIATELHDGVNHDLLTLKNKHLAESQNDSLEIENIINNVRRLSRNLYPAMFEQTGLEQSIITLCEKTTASGLFTTCEIDYQEKLEKNIELNIFRIIQEALNNTVKHAKADAAKIILTSNAQLIELIIKDNGKGFNINEKEIEGSSFGLNSIKQRASFMQAKVSFTSTQKGTEIKITKRNV